MSDSLDKYNRRRRNGKFEPDPNTAPASEDAYEIDKSYKFASNGLIEEIRQMLDDASRRCSDINHKAVRDVCEVLHRKYLHKGATVDKLVSIVEDVCNEMEKERMLEKLVHKK
jgi:hypothetical protein